MSAQSTNRPTTQIERIVIVGAGLAGTHAAEELRDNGYDGSLTLVGTEPHQPYDRPPLSKSVLLAEADIDSTTLHPASWYDERGIQLMTGETAVALDPAARRVRAGEWTIGYDRLLLATGSRARRLPLADESGAEVRYLRTRDDALALQPRLSGRLLVVGGGWIGLEIAAAARAVGGDVILVESAPRPLAGVLGPEIAEVFADLHRSHGVDLRTDATLLGLERAGYRSTARLTDGTTVDVDTVVVGIGAEPSTALAEAAGLACSNGIDVDPQLRSSDPFVYAAGDVANHDHPMLGRLRVEHWDNAIQQGRHAARNLLGADAPYTQQPYFFSDQYDLGMEYVGHVGSGGYDRLHVEGDLLARVFTAFWVREDTIVAGMHVNSWDAGDSIRQRVGGPAAALLG